MPRILVVTHGGLAEAFQGVLGMLFGEDAREVVALGLMPEDSSEAFGGRVAGAIRDAHSDDGVLVFVDVMSGTPFNVVAMAMHDLAEQCPNVECLAGVNLPVLMEAFASRQDLSLEDLVGHVTEVFPQTLSNVREVLGL